MIRNFLFNTFFFMGIILISIIFIPAFFLPQKITLIGGKIMGHWASFCLRFFLSTKLVVKGRENIINDKKFFIAASHQSMFETFFLQTIFNSPVFILKKELLMIPLFGWYLKKIGSISIKRNKISKDNLGFFGDVLKLINTSDRPLIIFPPIKVIF
jgi:1-acyl-sn-glycerol-3-phosphate acyltransferase